MYCVQLNNTFPHAYSNSEETCMICSRKVGNKLSRYKICVYAICKNEEQFVDRWMDAVKEADLIVVTDTGSTDQTVAKLRERGAIVYEEEIKPWRFDVARNLALLHVPEDVAICVSNDLDEIFEPGWRDKLESAWYDGCTRARYLFTWSFHEDGTPNKQFAMEKIHSRDGYQWIHPVHEVLEYSKGKEAIVWVPNMVLNHYPDLKKPRSQYLPLLELSAQENPNDDRTIFWLGREYYYHKQYAKSIQTLKHHLSLQTATWPEERSASMRFIACCYEEQQQYSEAKKWLYQAVAECSEVREPYLALAKIAYLEKNWPMVYAMVVNALKITKSSGSYLVEPESWGFSLYDYGAIAAYQLGLYEEAKELAEQALSMQPDDARLQTNLAMITQKCGVKEHGDE